MLLTLSGSAIASDLSKNISSHSVSDNMTDPVSVPNVATLLNNASQYVGNPIILSAIVSKTYPSQHQFTIADKVGCSLCTAKNALNSITVWYQGEIPKVRETVRISGSVIHDERSGYAINATYVRN
jgi:hypothetical protein